MCGTLAILFSTTVIIRVCSLSAAVLLSSAIVEIINATSYTALGVQATFIPYLILGNGSDVVLVNESKYFTTSAWPINSPRLA